MDMPAFDDDVIRRFRAGEQIEGLHRDGLVLLTTTGRRSGTRRTAPMMFVDVEGDPLVIASNAGAAEHPAWFVNLLADPRVTVETPDGRSEEAVAEVLEGEERARVRQEKKKDRLRVEELIRLGEMDPHTATSFLNDAGYAYRAMKEMLEGARLLYSEPDGAMAEVERLLTMDEDVLDMSEND